MFKKTKIRNTFAEVKGDNIQFIPYTIIRGYMLKYQSSEFYLKISDIAKTN